MPHDADTVIRLKQAVEALLGYPFRGAVKPVQLDVGCFLGDLALMPPGDLPNPADADEQIQSRKLTALTYVVIAPAKWERRLLGMDWTSLAELPWIGTPPDSVHHRLLNRIVAEH